jgi:hypothetical protein
MARARKKNTPKRRKTSPTLASGAAEMNGAAAAAFAGGKVIETLPRGRSRKYDHDAITKVAEEAIRECVDDKLAWYIDRVAGKLEHDGIKVPGPTVLREKCAPIYKRELARK